jgi:hypothetical protein
VGLSKHLCVGEERSCSSSSFNSFLSLALLMYPGVRGLSRNRCPAAYLLPNAKACLCR